MTDWRTQAACAGDADVTYADDDPWFPPAGQQPPAWVIKLCAACPVRQACLTEALTEPDGLKPDSGYRGGMTGLERAEYAKAHPVPRRNRMSAEAEALREQLYREGLGDAAIAERLGVDEWRVRKWRNRHMLPNNDGVDQFAERQSLYDQGLPDTAIGKQTGVSRDAIRTWRLRRGLPPNPTQDGVSRTYVTPLTPLGQEGDNRYQLWQDGLTDREIAEAVGVYVDTIRKWRCKNKLAAVGKRAS